MTDHEQLARSIIDANSFMAIGTADEAGVPWVSPVWYSTDDHRQFFWISDPNARHSRNLAERPRISIVIYDSHVPGTWTSVYMSALAEELTGGAIDSGVEIYSRRSQAVGLEELTRDEVVPPARHRIYRATASEHFVLGERDRRMPVGLA